MALLSLLSRPPWGSFTSRPPVARPLGSIAFGSPLSSWLLWTVLHTGRPRFVGSWLFPLCLGSPRCTVPPALHLRFSVVTASCPSLLRIFLLVQAHICSCLVSSGFPSLFGLLRFPLLICPVVFSLPCVGFPVAFLLAISSGYSIACCLSRKVPLHDLVLKPDLPAPPAVASLGSATKAFGPAFPRPLASSSQSVPCTGSRCAPPCVWSSAPPHAPFFAVLYSLSVYTIFRPFALDASNTVYFLFSGYSSLLIGVFA